LFSLIENELGDDESEVSDKESPSFSSSLSNK